MQVASDSYEARLQVGRVLTGSALAAVVSLRNLAVGLLAGGVADGDALAPAWVVVSRRADGKEIGRLAAGRELGAGEALLAAVNDSLRQLEPEAFLLQYRLASR